MRTTGWCIRHGYLVPPRQAFVRVALNLANLHDRLARVEELDDEDAGDELSGLLIGLLGNGAERSAATFAAGVTDVVGSRRAIIFSPPRVTAAKLLASWLNATGHCSCEAVWGGRVDKAEVLGRFCRGGLPQCLSNVNLLAEGFNAPEASAVCICRMIRSWRMGQQMVGRVLRPSAKTMLELSRLDGPGRAAERVSAIGSSDKPEALVADLVGLDDRVLQASAVEVLYADQPENVRAEMGRVLQARRSDLRPRQEDEPDETALEEARSNLLRRQREQLDDMARRRAMAGELDVAVSVTDGSGCQNDQVSWKAPSVLTTGASLAQKAYFVAVATQYDLQRATDIANRTPRHRLNGMTFNMKQKLDTAGQRPDWNRARRAFPEWAAAKDIARGARR